MILPACCCKTLSTHQKPTYSAWQQCHHSKHSDISYFRLLVVAAAVERYMRRVQLSAQQLSYQQQVTPAGVPTQRQLHLLLLAEQGEQGDLTEPGEPG